MTTNFHTLYQQYAQDVYRFAYWLCGDPQEAEDITSETFVRALTTAEALRVETVKAYLLTIARHLALKRIQSNRRFATLDPEFSDPGSSPAQSEETRQEIELVSRTIRALPEIDRAAFLMRFEQDLAYEEIARALGISLSAAKVKIHRARLKIISARDQAKEK